MSDNNFVPFNQPRELTPERMSEVALFILKLATERVNEARALYKAGDREEVKILVAEGQLLSDAHALIRRTYGR